MTSRTRFQSLSATLVAGAVVLALAGCGLLPTASAAGASPAAEAAPASPSSSPSALASPVGDPEQAVLDFFAAFDHVVLTGDPTSMTDLSTPECLYCTVTADVGASYGQHLGLADLDAADLAEIGFDGFGVTVQAVDDADDGTAVVEVDLDPPFAGTLPKLSEQRAEAKGLTITGGMQIESLARPTRARLALISDGDQWFVDSVTELGTAADTASMFAPTEDDAVVALEHYLELERQVYLTGDSSAAEQMAHEECQSCTPRLQLARDSYAAGMQVEGATSTVELKFRTPTAGALGEDFGAEVNENMFVLSTTVHRAEADVVIDGVEQVHPAASYTLDASLWYDGAQWFVVGLTESL